MPWPTRTHNALLDYAFGGRVDQHTLDALKAASARQDDPFGGQQGPGGSFMHSMAEPGEAPAEARRRRDEFIDLELTQARVLAHADRDAALETLGAALHAMMDATSPAHVSPSGDPYEWHGLSLRRYFEILHHAGVERGPPPAEVREYLAVRMRAAYAWVFGRL